MPDVGHNRNAQSHSEERTRHPFPFVGALADVPEEVGTDSYHRAVFRLLVCQIPLDGAFRWGRVIVGTVTNRRWVVRRPAVLGAIPTVKIIRLSKRGAASHILQYRQSAFWRRSDTSTSSSYWTHTRLARARGAREPQANPDVSLRGPSIPERQGGTV